MPSGCGPPAPSRCHGTALTTHFANVPSARALSRAQSQHNHGHSHGQGDGVPSCGAFVRPTPVLASFLTFTAAHDTLTERRMTHGRSSLPSSSRAANSVVSAARNMVKASTAAAIQALFQDSRSGNEAPPRRRSLWAVKGREHGPPCFGCRVLPLRLCPPCLVCWCARPVQ